MKDPSALTILAIGASAGGVDAIRTVVSDLPEDLDAAVFVTLHIGAHKSDLPWLLSRAGPMSASHPRDGDEIKLGHIHVAPPDHHMLVEAGVVRLTKGPRENWARPAIDPMLRSAARAYGPNVIGVILTGGLNDGTAGLFELKQRGGTTVVQDPDDAISENMPRSALTHVVIDHVASVREMGPLLTRLVSERTEAVPENAAQAQAQQPREQAKTAEFTSEKPVAVTCPDCGGALRQIETGSLTQFRCHIGHIYTTEIMLAAQFLALERFIEQAMRSLDERAELCRHMAEKSQTVAGVDSPAWLAAKDEALEQTVPLRVMLTREWIHPAGGGIVEPSSP